MHPVEVARQQPPDGAGGAGDDVEVTLRRAAEIIVHDDRRDGGDETDRGRQQGLGNAGGDNSQICRLGFRNTDEAVHDAPDRAKQADEWRRRADRREQAHALPDGARFGADDLRKYVSDPLLDAALVR